MKLQTLKFLTFLDVRSYLCKQLGITHKEFNPYWAILRDLWDDIPNNAYRRTDFYIGITDDVWINHYGEWSLPLKEALIKLYTEYGHDDYDFDDEYSGKILSIVIFFSF